MPAVKLALGGKALFKNVHRGRIAYVGEVHFASGEHVGLELAEPVGNCNGTIGGTAYFACDDLHGVMTTLENVTMVDANHKQSTTSSSSPSSVQSISKRLLARRKVAKERNSKVWNTLDNMNEQLAIKRSLQLQNLFGSRSSSKDLVMMEPKVVHLTQ